MSRLESLISSRSAVIFRSALLLGPLVPTSELFRAMQRGAIEAVQSDDHSIAAPVDVSVFGGNFRFFANRYDLDAPALFNPQG